MDNVKTACSLVPLMKKFLGDGIISVSSSGVQVRREMFLSLFDSYVVEGGTAHAKVDGVDVCAWMGD